jgi:hypothetical protein
MFLVTHKAGAKHTLFFNKLTSAKQRLLFKHTSLTMDKLDNVLPDLTKEEKRVSPNSQQ